MRNREQVVNWLRALLATTGAVNMAVGAWAEIAPHNWYRIFPGAGHHWVSAVGPYDEHLVRDVGASLLALGLLMVWTAAAPRASVLRPAMVSVLVFSVLHFAYHAAAWEHMGVGDNIANLVVLSLVVLVPAALLWFSRTRPQPRPRTDSQPGGRIAPVPESERSAEVRAAERYSRKRWGTVVSPLVPLTHHAQLLRGHGAMELALEHSHQVDQRLKDLGATKAAQITGCEWCIDFGSALLERHGYSETSSFGPVEQLVLEYAEALSATPAEVSDDLFARMREHFDDAQLVELTSAIAFESYRSRLYRAFAIGSQGFATCELPARGAPTVR
jgi:AhpD family alkylhydroperoxidase